MRSLKDVTTGAIAGTIGIFGSQMRGVNLATRLLAAGGMTGFAAGILYAHPNFTPVQQNHYAVILGTVIPIALDSALRYGLNAEDYIINPLVLAVTLALSALAMGTNRGRPDDMQYDVELERWIRPLLQWNLNQESPDYGTVQQAPEMYQL